MCGDKPPRGVCIESKGKAECVCLPNTFDPSRPYTGPFCLSSDPVQLSQPADWTPVIIGSIAGVVGLIALMSGFLWVMSLYRQGLPTPG